MSGGEVGFEAVLEQAWEDIEEGGNRWSVHHVETFMATMVEAVEYWQGRGDNERALECLHAAAWAGRRLSWLQERT